MKTYKVEIELKCEWIGESKLDVMNQIKKELGNLNNIENNIKIEETTQSHGRSSK